MRTHVNILRRWHGWQVHELLLVEPESTGFNEFESHADEVYWIYADCFEVGISVLLVIYLTNATAHEFQLSPPTVRKWDDAGSGEVATVFG